MPQQKIIRHDSTLDRGTEPTPRLTHAHIKTTREQVLEAIVRYPNERFTSPEIAEFMGMPENEYSVRTAIHWLRRNKIIVLANETRRKVYRTNTVTVSLINVYFRAKQCEVDFELLNRAFLRFAL